MAFVDDAVERAGRGDHDGAMAALRRAVDSGDPLAAGEGGIKLGIMRKRAGEYRLAADAYRAAVAAGHPDKAAVAAFLLGGVLSQLGEFDEAVAAYEQVAADHEQGPAALLCLAEVHRFDRDDPAAADRAYRQAIDTGDAGIAPRAMVGLADFVRAAEPDRAAELYRRAADSDHPDAAPMARRALREETGTPAGEPSTRRAKSVDGCLLMLDGDGAVTGLWFEDPAVGDAHAADAEKVKGILIANELTSLLSAGYTAAADPETGGYRVVFRL